MAVNAGLFSSDNSEWETPIDLYTWLDQHFNFTLDVCAWDWNAKAPAWLTPFDDALSLDWVWVCTEIVGGEPIMWMNPPYGRVIGDWIAKAEQTARDGGTVVALVPARTDTRYWHTHIWDPLTDEPRPGVRIKFLQGRLRFGGARNSAPFPSTIVVFGEAVAAEGKTRRRGRRNLARRRSQKGKIAAPGRRSLARE